MMNRCVRLALAVALAVAFLAGSVHAATWKVSHVRPQGTAIDNDLNWLADAMEKATEGKIKLKIYPASSLGDYTVVQERVGLGAVEMACQPPATGADKRLQVIYFPYLFNNWEQARKNYDGETPLRKSIAGLYAKQGIRMLGAWPAYFGGIALNHEPKAPGDPNAAKGLKLRVPPMKSFQMLADHTGYIGTPLPFSEAFTAVQTGVVDGVIGSGAEGYYASFRDVTKYYIPLNTHFEVWYLLLNEETFQDLDKDMQQKVLDVARQFEDRRWENAKDDQAANEKRLADYGAEIVEISQAQIDATAEKIRKEVWPEILSDVGEEWGQKVLDGVIK
jgi:TRAP-type C4-dicarboxylate transport system substrate-binding protein